MLESILQSIKKSIFVAGLYAVAVGCGGDTFGSSVSRDAGADMSYPDAQALCVDKDEDTFYSQPNCGTQVDCDDENNGTFPGAIEFCDYKDNNCDGEVDEGAGRTVYRDFDGDKFGNKNIIATSCFDSKDKPKGMFEGYVYNPGDCDDNDREINPDAPELCDEVDQDCDGNNYNGFPVGEDCSNEQLGECSLGGSYICSPDASAVLCDAPVGLPEDESCDGLDNNCDGRLDNDITRPSRDCTRGVGECERPGLEYKVCRGVDGWSTEFSGCDAVPAAPVPELCDNLDNDCNGEPDNFTRLTDCPGLIRATYTQECREGTWFDINLEDCPECLEGTRRDTACCGYDGQGIRGEICIDEHWVDSGDCSIENFINASNHPARDNQPSIDGDDLLFASTRSRTYSDVFLLNVSGVAVGVPTNISIGINAPTINNEAGREEWHLHECENGSIGNGKISFECNWQEHDGFLRGADDSYPYFIYVVDLLEPGILLNLRNQRSIAAQTPDIDDDKFVSRRMVAPYNIEVRNSTTGALLDDFGVGESYPVIDSSIGYVAFSSRRDGGGISRVYLGDIILEEDPLRISGDAPGNDGYRPTIDGNDVVFVSERDDGVRKLYHYYIAAAGEPERLTNCGPNYGPDVNNRKVAFISERTGNPEIYVCNLEETRDCCADAVNISNSPLSIENDPSISGCKVAYVSNRDGNEEIYVHDLCEGGCREE